MKVWFLAILVPPLLLLGWIAVQEAWRRQFPVSDADGDVLAGRSDCGQCGCATPCERRQNEQH